MSNGPPTWNPGSTMLRWAAIEAAQQAWRPNNPWNQLYIDVKQRCGGKGNPAKAPAPAAKAAVTALLTKNKRPAA